MDPLTHCALGAACAMAVARSGWRRAAALAGVAAGLLPDADVFIRSQTDPLLGIEFHRHFTHAVVFQPVVAVLAATLAWALCWKARPRWRDLWLPGLLAGLSHIFCDAWTSYGTRLWWPFSEARAAWDLVSIIDPLLTVPLVVLALLGLNRPSRKLPLAGLAWVAVYLGIGAMQHQRAASALRELAAGRGQAIERMTVKPSFGNTLVWRGLYESGGRYFSVALRPGLGSTTILEGDSAPVFQTAQAALPAGSRMADDLRRFAHFSDQWLAVAAQPGDGTVVVGDARYSLLPQKMAPLWGVVLDPSKPGQHVRWMNFRQVSKRDWQTLWRMVQAPLAKDEEPEDSAG